MTEFEKQVLSDLAILKTEMKQLVGNGQPGRLQQIEERVEEHEKKAQQLAGMAALIGFLVTCVHIAVDYFRMKR